MKTLGILFVSLFALSAQANIIFANNSPLPQPVKEQINDVVSNKCNVTGLQIVESRTLVSQEEAADATVVTKYYTTLAALTSSSQVYASVEVLSTIIDEKLEVNILRGPLCRF